MAERGSRRRRPSRRALIGPLVMLAGGMASGALVWRTLMLDDPAATPVAGEQLSRHDQQALDQLLNERRSH
jgi:uncharacterized membrane protein